MEGVYLTLLMVLPFSEVLMVMLYFWSFFRPWGQTQVTDPSPSTYREAGLLDESCQRGQLDVQASRKLVVKPLKYMFVFY